MMIPEELSAFIQQEMLARGFKVDNEFSRIKPMADAIGAAVVLYIQQSATVITDGSTMRVN